MAEIPVCLQPDGRDRPPHLRSLRDGVRHLRVLFGKRRRAGGVRMHLVAFLVGCAAVLLGLWIMNTPRGGPIAFDVPETVVLSKDEFVGKVLKIPCKISSSEPVDIVGARTSCGCIRVNGLPRRIEPRATESVDIELNVADFKRMFREKGLPLMARYRIEYLVVDHDPVEQIVTISVQDDRRRR